MIAYTLYGLSSHTDPFAFFLYPNANLHSHFSRMKRDPFTPQNSVFASTLTTRSSERNISKPIGEFRVKLMEKTAEAAVHKRV
jgi:hypothetical protein